MKLNKSILILALEDSIASHKKAGAQCYSWTIKEMEKNLEIIKQAHSVEAHEEKIKLFDGCYVQTADGLVHGPVVKVDDSRVPFFGPDSLRFWMTEDGVIPTSYPCDGKTIVKVLDKNEV